VKIQVFPEVKETQQNFTDDNHTLSLGDDRNAVGLGEGRARTIS
jgi:hypothetical protein